MSYLVQIIVPTYFPTGEQVTAAEFARIRRELTDQFGGVTAHTRAPAVGLWEDPEGHLHRDDVVIVEVMTPAFDRAWWKRYADELGGRLQQEALVVRAIPLETL